MGSVSCKDGSLSDRRLKTGKARMKADRDSPEMERLRVELSDQIEAMQRPASIRGMNALLSIDTAELNGIIRDEKPANE